jgi:hypothetical protein
MLFAVLALAAAALADPAVAKHRNNDWQQNWNGCDGWQCDQWQQGWPPQPWQPGWRQSPPQPWQPGWQQGRPPLGFAKPHKNWQGGRLVPQDVITRQVTQHGYSRIYGVELDDDKPIYKVRAKDRHGRIVKLFFDAWTGRFISETIIR